MSKHSKTSIKQTRNARLITNYDCFNNLIYQQMSVQNIDIQVNSIPPLIGGQPS